MFASATGKNVSVYSSVAGSLVLFYRKKKSSAVLTNAHAEKGKKLSYSNLDERFEYFLEILQLSVSKGIDTFFALFRLSLASAI